MLKQLRQNKTKKRILIFLAIVIIPAFAFWGFSSVISDKKKNKPVGKIFGRTIAQDEFQAALTAVRNTAVMRFGDKYNEIQKYLNLDNQAWERLVLLYDAKKKKIKVADKEVTDLIQSYPFFQRNGRFDDKTYNQIVRYYFHVQPREFEEQTRQDLMLLKLYNKVTDSTKINDADIKAEYQKLNEEITLDYIASIPADFAKDITPTEEQLKDFYKQNSLVFKQPPSYNVEYITIDSENKARDLLTRIDKKADLAKISKDINSPLKETGFFAQNSAVPGIGWSPEVISIISKLKLGELSPLFEMENKYFLLRIKEQKEAYVPEFDKIKEAVKERFIQEETKKLAKQKIDDCYKALSDANKLNPKSVNLEKNALAFGLKVAETKPFKFGSYIEGIGSSDNFWVTANKLKENEFSEIITETSGFFIIKLKSRSAIDENKFQKEKQQFSLLLLSQKKEEAFGKFLEDLKKRASGS